MDLEAVQEIEVDVEETGLQGYSAYEVAVQNGFEGTEEEWLESLKGADGTDGATGPQGLPGADGQDGADATINGVSAINIVAGENITLDQEDGTLTINSTGGGTRDYADLTNKPSINNVTLNGNKSLSDLGAGTYDKPASGIPKTDLASDVQASLSKADTALQSETYTGTITGITMNGSSKGTSGIVDLGTVITQHQDISGKQDALTAGTNITIDENNVISATGGSGETLLYSLVSDMASTAEWNSIITLPNTDLLKLTEIIQEVYNNGDSSFNLIVSAANNWKSPLTFTYGRARESIQAKPTSLNLFAIASDNPLTTTTFARVLNVGLVVSLTWNGDIVSVTSARISTNKTSYLATENTATFVPTGDYNPATKKYVDDSIAAAITTTLGGSF